MTIKPYRIQIFKNFLRAHASAISPARRIAGSPVRF